MINLTKEQMDKKIEQEAPQLISLRKQAVVSLEKCGLANEKAKVCLVLDISASMDNYYRSGLVSEVKDKVLALASVFADAEIEVFFFGRKAHYVGACNLSNYQEFLQNALREYPLEGGTYYGDVVDMVNAHYFNKTTTSVVKKQAKGFFNKLFNVQETETITEKSSVDVDIPVLSIFFTDGDCHDRGIAYQAFKRSSHNPIFWFTIAFGNGEFRLLDKLDDNDDFFTDNVSVSKISPDQYGKVSESWLYDELGREYKNYPTTARKLGLLK